MNDSSHVKLVQLHVDRQPVKSPTPTNGEARYAVAGVRGAHKEVVREVGNRPREGQVVDRHAPRIDLQEDDHFYTDDR